MKPDQLPPTIPLLAIPMNHSHPALPSLSRRIASYHVNWHHVAATALLALYVAVIVYSAFVVHNSCADARAAIFAEPDGDTESCPYDDRRPSRVIPKK